MTPLQPHVQTDPARHRGEECVHGNFLLGPDRVDAVGPQRLLTPGSGGSRRGSTRTSARTAIRFPAALLLVVILAGTQGACAADEHAALAPFSDQQFRAAVVALSEPPGNFAHDDNLVSNEAHIQELAAALDASGGAYIGVGPEQNFTYIATLRPVMAFVIDIRQDNRNLHLLYKALFALADDRADFLSRLFSRQRPPDAARDQSIDDLFDALGAQPPSRALLDATLRDVRQHLVETRQLPLAPADLLSIAAALEAFHQDGPEIRYGRREPARKARPTYRQLMTGRDHRGVQRSYLASDDAFRYVKQLQAANRLLPLVGDFAGTHAMRRVGEFVRQHGEIVSGVYASNVEVYLTRDQRRVFCGHLAGLPARESTFFIGNGRRTTLAAKLAACAHIQPSLQWP